MILHFLISLFLFTISHGEECTLDADNCPGGQCLESKLDCHHGTCQNEGKCKCLPCYTGAYCDVYYDAHEPYMNLLEDEVFVNASGNAEIIYKVEASDGDFDIICNSYDVICPCSEFYFILRNQSNEFILDTHGNLKIRQGVILKPSETYTLTVSLIGGNTYNGKDFDTDILFDEMTIKVRCLTGNEYLHYQTNVLEPNQGKRTKRETNVAPSAVSEVTLTMTSPDPGTLRPGLAATFKIDVVLAASVVTDLKIRITTRDIETEEANLAVWGVNVESIGQHITKEEGIIIETPIVPTYTNIVGSILYVDIAEIDFGSLVNGDTYNSDGTDLSDSTITITFSITMTDITDYTPGNTSVYVGVQYGEGQYIWVAHASFPYEFPTMEYQQQFTVTGPDTVPQYAGALLEISSYISNPYAVVHVEVSSVNNTHDTLSIEHIRLVRKGANTNMFPFPKLKPEYRKSITDKTNFMGKLSFTSLLALEGIVEETEGIGDDKYEYVIQIVAFVGNAEIGHPIGIFLGIQTEGVETKWGDVVYLTVTEEDSDTEEVPEFTLVMMTEQTPLLRPYESEVYGIRFDLTGLSNPMDCTVTPTVATDVVKGVMWGDCGVYVSRFPNLREEVTYADDGSAQWSISLNMTTFNPTYHTEDNGEAYGLILVSILSTVAAPSEVNVICNDDATKIIPAATHNTNGESGDPSGVVSIPQDDNKWYPGSIIALASTVNFKGTGYSNVVYESIVDLGENIFSVEVCKVEVVGVGTGIGSILRSASQLENLITYGSTTNANYNSLVNVTLGTVGGGEMVDSVSSDYDVEFRVYFDLPLGQATPIVAGDYNVASGLVLGDRTLWVGDSTYAIVDGIPPQDPTSRPILETSISPSSKNALGQPQLVIASIKTIPGAIAANKLTVSATLDSVICAINILTVGRNLACVDKNFHGKEDDPKQKIKATWDPIDRSSKVTLDLGINRNFGGSTNNVYLGSNLDEDSIEIGIFVRGKTETTPSFSIDFALQTGPDGSSHTFTSVMELDASGVIVPSVNADLLLAAPSDTTAYEEVLTTISFNITVPVDYTRNVVIEAKADPAKLTQPCYLAVVQSGQNVPCAIHSSTLKAVYTGTDTESKLSLNIGKICYFPVQPTNTSENVVQLQVGVKILTGATDGSVIISVLEEGVEKSTATITIGNSGVFELVQNISLLNFAMTGPDAPVVLGPGTLARVSAFLTLPPYVTLPMKIGVFTESKDGRAIATVNAVRAGAITGRNIGCLDDKDIPLLTLTQNYTNIDDIPLIHTSQNNILITEPVYVTNTGVTYLRGDGVAEDNVLQLEAEILIADHEFVANNDEFHVYFSIMYGEEVILIEKMNYTMNRTGSETHAITTKIFLLDAGTTFYQSGSTIGFGVTLAHDMTLSKQEIYDAIVRVCLPESIAYVTVDDIAYTDDLSSVVGTFESNITAVLTKGVCLDFNIDYLFFTDILSLNLTVNVDPYNILPRGLANIDGVAVLRLLGKEGTSSGSRIYPILPNFVEFQFGSEDSFDDLKIELYLPCQFTASSAVDELNGPEKAASLTGEGWLPSSFATPISSHNIRIDFLRLTRVTKVQLIAVTDWELPTSYTIKTSNDGILFTNVCETKITLDTDPLPYECRFVSRFAMIAFDSLRDSSLTLGIKMKLFGMYMGEKIADCPSPMTPTFYSTSSEGTNVLYDSVHDVLYFCYHAYMKGGSNCFSTKDGHTFKSIYPVKSLAGFDNTLGMVFGRVGTDNNLLASTDGSMWNVVSNSIIPDVFDVPAIIVPAKPSSSFNAINLDGGDWQVTFDGIAKGTDVKIKSEG